ncbi:E3 ubiquitin-protein ligase TRIM33-like [Mizuhopecten yessoensis]|uniref:E3 ubiquitin-protein ligase TRIM33-like n=1 Tax=Mizuhopecten yessoensis TaxID=6573 RepID=UPI000B45B27C|nr:E3 ubiquitin-protein ligase TRIM33-like [Mizuhopecten yessoensis]
MAEGGPLPELDLHLLECPICLERLRQPKSLPCLHCFCQDCLGTYITKELSGKIASATSFPCPVCRGLATPVNQAETKENWAKQFPTNGVIQELIKLKEQSSDPLYCTPCQSKGNMSNPAKFWCKKMESGFCETCKVDHHDVIHIECDILDVTTYDNSRPNQNTSVPHCDKHGENIVWYCEDHKVLGCNICVFKDHRRCEQVTTSTEYFHMLKTGSQLQDMQAALKIGADVMASLVKDFDEQLQTMVENQEIALQSITELRQRVDKRLDKLQKEVTDELIKSFKEEKRTFEASLRQCQRLMNGMLNTHTMSVTAVKKNVIIETIVLYQRGQAEVESCKALVMEMNESFTSVNIQHNTEPGLETFCDDAMGNIVIEKQPRCLPGSHDKLVPTLLHLERCVKEIRKFNIKTRSDEVDCDAVGVVYLPDDHIVVSDLNNQKLKLFTDKGQYLDELAIDGKPWDMCLVNNNTVAVAVSSPGGVNVLKVENSKLTLSYEINMPDDKLLRGITHINGQFVVGTEAAEVYRLTQDGGAELLYQYTDCVCSLSHDPRNGDILVSGYTGIERNAVLSRLSGDKRSKVVQKFGLVKWATGVDMDKTSNIYVCGLDSHNVVEMSGDGTYAKELLTSRNGMFLPWAIAIRGRMCVITEEDANYVRLFQLY